MVLGSFYRFVILKDYLVAYEGECDPETESCFVGCEDDECLEFYYHSVIERKANEIYSLCGPDISECNEAYFCPETESNCSIYYCDATSSQDECDNILDKI